MSDPGFWISILVTGIGLTIALPGASRILALPLVVCPLLAFCGGGP